MLELYSWKNSMKEKYYTIVIFFKAKPGKEKRLKEFLYSITHVALQSSGCIKHDLHHSLNDPAVFMFYETWINKEAHEQHILRPEVQEWRANLHDFLAVPYDLSFWETT